MAVASEQGMARNDGGSATAGYGNRIKTARLGVNKTRQQLADAVGVQYATIARYEREINPPHDGVAVAIARVTRTTAAWLLLGE